ncbi:carbonic anhydrase [Mycena polygramma]|nr:carbonic anhydrase [Mycena polygramma]
MDQLAGFRTLKQRRAVTCMDPRINKEALRSITVAQHFIGIDGEIAVFHHKDCGMSRVTTDEMRNLVKKANPGRDDVAATVDGTNFCHIEDIEGSVRTDVKFLAETPLVLKGTRISGWVYDVDTGKVSTAANRRHIC